MYFHVKHACCCETHTEYVELLKWKSKYNLLIQKILLLHFTTACMQSDLATAGNGSACVVCHRLANDTYLLPFLTTNSNVARVHESKFLCKNYCILLIQKKFAVAKRHQWYIGILCSPKSIFCIIDAKVYIAICC